MYEFSDIIEMKKSHACGMNRWEIIRVGADMKIKCQGCNRIVMLTRHDFDRRFKKVLEKIN